MASVAGIPACSASCLVQGIQDCLWFWERFTACAYWGIRVSSDRMPDPRRPSPGATWVGVTCPPYGYVLAACGFGAVLKENLGGRVVF